MQNNYKRFFVKIFIFFVFIGILDFFVGNFLSYLYFKQSYGTLYQTTYSIKKTDHEVLIFGSSRAAHHYNPQIFKDSLGLSCYNVGRNATNILYHYAILKATLNRYIPKIIVLDINVEEFIFNQNSYDRLSSLLPYYKEHPEIKEIVLLRSPFEKVKLFSNIYPFNSMIFSAIYRTEKFNSGKDQNISGYEPIYSIKWNEKIQNYPYIKNSYKDNIKIKYLDKFIKTCKNNNIKLFIVVSPYFYTFPQTDTSIEYAKKKTISNGIGFMSFLSDSTFINRPSLFKDPLHLNNEGATIFSKKIVSLLKKEI